MSKVYEVIENIENVAPLSLQEDYDNCGLQIGDTNIEVKGIMIALNLDLDVINEAKKLGANMIITHHPLLFNAIKQINLNTYQGKVINEVIKNNFVVYSSHTAFDSFIGEKNIKRFGAENIFRLGEVVIGDIDTNIEKLRDIVKKVTDDKEIHISHLNKPIKRVAYINGSGGRMDNILDTLIDNDVDCFISSEFKYSFLLDLVNNNIEVLELNHFNSEKEFNELMKNKLSMSFNNVCVYTLTQNPYDKE